MRIPCSDDVAFGMAVCLLAVILYLVGVWLWNEAARWLRERKGKRKRRRR